MAKASSTVKAPKAQKAASKAQKAAKAPKAQNPTPKPSKAQKPANGFQNPYRQSGGYWSSVEGLRSLGVGKLHSHEVIVPAVKKAMGAAWKAFSNKDGKLSADERVLMNVMVTSRSDYGKPLREVGYEVRWDGREKVAGLFKL